MEGGRRWIWADKDWGGIWDQSEWLGRARWGAHFAAAVKTQLRVSCLCLRQVWKRSGAWFYKGLPKYITPLKSSSSSKPLELQPQPWQGEEPEPESVGSSRSFTWARGKGWLFLLLAGSKQSGKLSVKGVIPRGVMCFSSFMLWGVFLRIH